VTPNPSIERTSNGRLRRPLAAAHVQRSVKSFKYSNVCAEIVKMKKQTQLTLFFLGLSITALIFTMISRSHPKPLTPILSDEAEWLLPAILSILIPLWAILVALTIIYL
jgi:hypothetical protein